jgi:hypothetical protein
MYLVKRLKEDALSQLLSLGKTNLKQYRILRIDWLNNKKVLKDDIKELFEDREKEKMLWNYAQYHYCQLEQ